jgi:hypothetical protein
MLNIIGAHKAAQPGRAPGASPHAATPFQRLSGLAPVKPAVIREPDVSLPCSVEPMFIGFG